MNSDLQSLVSISWSKSNYLFFPFATISTPNYLNSNFDTLGKSSFPIISSESTLLPTFHPLKAVIQMFGCHFLMAFTVIACLLEHCPIFRKPLKLQEVPLS